MTSRYLATLYKRANNTLKRKLGFFLFDTQVDEAVYPITDLKHIVFIRWDSKWGDTIVSSFVFEALKKAYPDARITVVTSPAIADFYKHYVSVDEVIESSRRPGYRSLKKLAKQLGSVDFLVHFSKFIKMKDMYFLSKVQARFIAGLDDEFQRINVKLGKKTRGKHFEQKFIFLLNYLDITSAKSSYKIPCNTEEMSQVESFLATKPAAPLLVINLYGAGKGRCLSAASSKKLISITLTILPTINIVILASPDTLPEVQHICSEVGRNNVFCYPQGQTIYAAIALVAKAEWVVSVDTAIVHIASGLKKPLFALYNPDKENYAEWHPNSAAAISFFADPVTPPDINVLAWQQLEPALSKLLLSSLPSVKSLK